MMESELEKWRSVRRGLSIAYIVLNTVYMVYRFIIINPHSLFLSWFYFIAEAIQFALGLNLIFSSWQYRQRETPAPIENALVEVWVPVYLEPIEVIQRTLRAAKHIEYPHQTCVLDDGKRPEIKTLAHELGITYLCRADNLNAKAGNLNFALRRSQADFIMVFDADHIPLPSAIDLLIGFFRDDQVGLIQTPQDYYNTDAFQYFNSKKTGGIWHDQSFFYGLAQPAMDRAGSATCVGTGVLYRRSALLAIGGIPEDTATEDIHTSLRLISHGWKTIFYSKPVAYGIAASNLEEYYKTRHRWAHGNLHALALEKIPFTKGMTWLQRLHHLSLGVIYLEGWQQLMLFMIPIIALMTGWQPFIITPFNVMVILFYPLLSLGLLQELGCGYSRIWANELFSMARWPVHIISSIGIFKTKILWKTSTKILRTRSSFSRVLPQVSIFLLSAIALSFAIRTLLLHFDEGVLLAGKAIDFNVPLEKGFTVDILIVAGGWAIYNMVRVAFFLKKAWTRSTYAQDDYRFKIELLVAAGEDDESQQWGKTIWIAEQHIRIRIARTQHVRAGDRMKICLPLPTGTLMGTLHCSEVVMHDENIEIEGKLYLENEQDAQRLTDALYSVFWYRDLRSNRPAFLTPLGWLRRIVSRNSLEKYRVLDEFIVLKEEDNAPIFATLHHGEIAVMTTAYTELDCDTPYTMLRSVHECIQHTNVKCTAFPGPVLPERLGSEGHQAALYRLTPGEELKHKHLVSQEEAVLQ
jgi:cellulose synthase/poly-beta-1,6-N-acetylglucosamine synthase-like glycosyltransferase